jgi:tetratricopeptide (TPR) repeat protein
MNEILTKIMEFFSTLQPKDWTTLVVSTFALVFSIFSLRQKAGEARLARREQLTDLLQKLSELNTEVSTYRALREAKKDEYPPNYVGLINDQRRFLVRQAAFVAAKIKRLVSPYEYLIIAGGFDSIDDTYQAEYFYQLASKTKDQIDRGIAIRGYGRYLFNRGRTEEARQYYSRALEAFKGDSDHLRHARGDTYERWAAHEREWGHPTEGDSLLEHAIAEYTTLTNPSRKSYETARVTKELPKSAVVEEESVKKDV